MYVTVFLLFFLVGEVVVGWCSLGVALNVGDRGAALLWAPLTPRCVDGLCAEIKL